MPFHITMTRPSPDSSHILLKTDQIVPCYALSERPRAGLLSRYAVREACTTGPIASERGIAHKTRR